MDDPILTIEEREAINSGRWFSSLSPSLRHDILRCAYVKRFKDGGLIAARGDPPEEWIACARVAVLEQFARREMALMRSLQMGGRATGNVPKGLAASRRLHRTADQAQEQLAEDDLLA